MSAERRVAPTCIVVMAVLAACDGARLSSTEQLAVVPSTSSVSFSGEVEVGASSTLARSIRFSPAGTGASSDEVTAVVETCADFSVTGPLPGIVRRTCAGTIPIDGIPTAGGGVEGDTGASCQSPAITVAEYDVVFAPVSKGDKSCSITFHGTFGQHTVSVTGRAAPPLYAMTVSRTAIDFGDVKVDTDSAPSVLEIDNVGGRPLTLDKMEVTGPPGVFAITGPTAGHQIAVDAKATYHILCHPLSTDEMIEGHVTVATAPLAPIKVSLRCSGTSSNLVGPGVDIRARHTIEALVQVDVRNTGTAAAQIVGYDLEAIPELSITQPGAIGSLAPGASTTVELRYSAEAVRPRMSFGTLSVHEAAPGGTRRIRIPISGEALPMEVGYWPSSTIDFGPICVGQPAKPRPVEVFANLAGFISVLAAPDPASPFVLTMDAPPDGFPVVISGGGQGSFAYTAGFTPSGIGAMSAKVNLHLDGPGGELRLEGEGMPSGVNASPMLLELGSVDRESGPSTKELVISNCTGAPLVIAGVRKEGPDAGQFEIVTPLEGPHMMVAAQDRTTFEIAMKPGKPGLKLATLVFEHSQGTTTVALVGSTIGQTALRESYYDCSAGGGGAAAWLIGLALAVVLRPRRRARA